MIKRVSILLAGPIGFAIMLMALIPQQIALAFASQISNWQAQCIILGIGAPILLGWESLTSRGVTLQNILLLKGFTHEEKWAAIRIAIGSCLVNPGMAFALAVMGLYQVAAIVALGSLAVGARLIVGSRLWGDILSRSIAVVTILVFISPVWGWNFENVLAIAANLGASWHFWNLPKSLGVLRRRKLENQAMAWANIVAMVIVLGCTLPFIGLSWVVTIPIWQLLIIGIGVLLVPVLLMNLANRFLSPMQMGFAMVLSLPISTAVGWIGNGLGYLPSRQLPDVLGIIGMVLLVVVSTVAVVRKNPSGSVGAAKA